jgi:hypothetical protein
VIPSGIDPGTLLHPSQALNHWENYHVDTAIPEHHLTFNGIVDLPVGNGKRLLHNTNKWLDALVGGYQVAFVGQLVSQSFQVNSTNWGATSPIQVLRAAPCQSMIAAAACAIPNMSGSTDTSRRR